MFDDLERFVTTHRACGEPTADVGEVTDEGYAVRPTCSCDVTFNRWIAPNVAGDNLLHSSLLTFPN